MYCGPTPIASAQPRHPFGVLQPLCLTDQFELDVLEILHADLLNSVAIEFEHKSIRLE